MAMTDEEYMLRAVELAKKGTGWTNLIRLSVQLLLKAAG